jgi:hypothetical protein
MPMLVVAYVCWKKSSLSRSGGFISSERRLEYAEVTDIKKTDNSWWRWSGVPGSR